MIPVTLVNRVLAALLALAMLLGGLLVAIETVLALLGRQHWLVPHEQWAAWLDGQTWESTTVRMTCVVAVLLGLLLLVVAARRGKPSILALPSGNAPGVYVQVSRRGVEKTLADVAREVEGVDEARASATRRRVTVQATAGGPTSGLADTVSAAVESRLAALGLASSLRPRVRISRRSSR